MEEIMQWLLEKEKEENPSCSEATDWAAASREAQRSLAEAAVAVAAHIAEKANGERLVADHRHAQASLALQQQWGVSRGQQKKKRKC